MINIKLNKRDKEIINLLSENSQINLRDISKNLKISKQAILKKIDKINNHFVIRYTTLTNYFMLGLSNVFIFYRIQGLKKEELNLILTNLSKKQNISWQSTLNGDYNIGLSLFYKDQIELYQSLSYIRKIFGKSIKKEDLFYIHEQTIVPFSFVKDIKQIIIKNKTPLGISKLDRKILNKIESNPRFEIYKLAENVKLSPITLKKHIKELQSRGIILGYGLIMDYPKLGLFWNICILNNQFGKNVDRIIQYLLKDRNVAFVSKTIGNHIIFDYITKNQDSLNEFLDKTLDNFSETIMSYKILNDSNVKKIKEIY